MSLKENKETVLECVRQLNLRNLDVFDVMADPSFKDYDPIPHQQPGIQGLKDAYQMVINGFPDVRFNPVDLVAEGDLVMGRGILRGTHLGPFLGVPATGRPVRWTGTRMFRVRGGKLFAGWISLDMLSLMAQITSPVPLPLPGIEGDMPDRDLTLDIPSRGSTPEENKALFRRMIEQLWSRKDLASAGELYSERYTNSTDSQLPSGPEGARAAASILQVAFPDLRTEVEYLLAEGDRVASRLRLRGTHTGQLLSPLGPIPATYKQVDFLEMNVLRVEGGKFVESWHNLDMGGVLTQLGVVPAPQG